MDMSQQPSPGEDYSERPAIDALGDRLIVHHVRADIVVETELRLRHELYSPYNFPGWIPALAANTQNWIEYSGTASEDPRAWWGLDLEVVSSGSFIEDEVDILRNRAAERSKRRSIAAHKKRCALHKGKNNEAGA